MPAKAWIEAALNGGWGRALQPKIPLSVAEGAAIIEGVRSQVDVIVPAQ